MIIFLFVLSLFSECSFDIHNLEELETTREILKESVTTTTTRYIIEGDFVMDDLFFDKATVITTRQDSEAMTVYRYRFLSTLRTGKTVKICYQDYEDFDDLLDCFCRDKELGYRLKKFLKWVSEHFNEIEWHSMRR